MIYTITFNPALDYVMDVDNIEIGAVNRSKSEHVLCGGKGINVSVVLRNLGVDSIALGYVAGFTGIEIENRLKEQGIKTDFNRVDNGISRINVKLKSRVETEINGAGPIITQKDISLLLDKIDTLQDGDVLVLAGSIPTSISDDVYVHIMEKVACKDVKVIVDATKDLLLNVLKYKPFLVKPNHHELGEMCGVICESINDVINNGRKIKNMGASNVLVSMADKGAVLITDEDIYYMKAPVGKVINSVGAGDSMVAGFMAQYIKSNNYKESLEYAVVTGSASAFSAELATKLDVENLLKEVELAEKL